MYHFAYITVTLYCVHVPCDLQLPHSFWLHVFYWFQCHCSRLYYHPPLFAAPTVEGIYIHTHCHVTFITFLWEENTFCPFAIRLDHVTCFGQNGVSKEMCVTSEQRLSEALFLSVCCKTGMFQRGSTPSGWIQESNGRRPQSTYN